MKRFEITITAVVEASSEDDVREWLDDIEGGEPGFFGGVRVLNLGSEVEERTPADARSQ